ncbi:MAG: ABC transporter permease [Candidatus Woesearchaeota archaeon]
MILPVVLATLKSFLRSRRTLLILFVLPIILIFFIFLSFNPEGLKQVPGGIAIDSGITQDEANELFEWLELTSYDDVEACLMRMRTGNEYVCMNVYGDDQVIFEVFFDNTREPVIWEIVTRVEQTLRSVERARTSEAASHLFESLGSVDDYLLSLSEESEQHKGQIESYQEDISALRDELSASRRELTTMIAQIDQDVARARSETSEMRSEHHRNVNEIRSTLTQIGHQLALLESMNVSTHHVQAFVNQAHTDLTDYDRRTVRRLNTLDNQIDQYDLRSHQANHMIARISEHEQGLAAFNIELGGFGSDLDSMARTAHQMSMELETVLEGTILVDSVRLSNIPSYVPDVDVRAEYEHFDGLSVLMLQTMFPSLLMLVVLFFGILLSSFMMLTHITTPAHLRLRLVDGSWYKDFFAMIIATVLVSSVMIGIVLGIGIYLFHIPIENMTTFAGLLFMILVVLSLIGILIVHVVWSESMSVIVAMFALIATLFSSGFILPIERMSEWAASLSQINPISIGLNAFDRAIFYGGTIPGNDWIILGAWTLLLVIGTLIIRLVREL